ncbi:c-type cytochrome [Halalkalibacillus halophilus]|uniref:c-type cytochrome n=1 Tax=Halalkalibacillus halophilus TaxID=392827 RepID=UPI0003F5FFE1|nr:cytochrome c [Halalkalibacillus halophilus]
MTKNPIVPFALIATLGIIAMIVMGGVGLSQMDVAEDGESTEEEGSMEPEAIFENNCMSCHGGDLEGGTGPALTDVGSDYDMEGLVDVIANGVEGSSLMTGDYANDEEAEVLAEWLMDQ